MPKILSDIPMKNPMKKIIQFLAIITSLNRLRSIPLSYKKPPYYLKVVFCRLATY